MPRGLPTEGTHQYRRQSHSHMFGGWLTLVVRGWTLAYQARDPERLTRHAMNQVQRLGYHVTHTPSAATA